MVNGEKWAQPQQRTDSVMYIGGSLVTQFDEQIPGAKSSQRKDRRFMNPCDSSE